MNIFRRDSLFTYQLRYGKHDPLFCSSYERVPTMNGVLSVPLWYRAYVSFTNIRARERLAAYIFTLIYIYIYPHILISPCSLFYARCRKRRWLRNCSICPGGSSYTNCHKRPGNCHLQTTCRSFFKGKGGQDGRF